MCNICKKGYTGRTIDPLHFRLLLPERERLFDSQREQPMNDAIKEVNELNEYEPFRMGDMNNETHLFSFQVQLSCF